jgi:hypothetical protein
VFTTEFHPPRRWQSPLAFPFRLISVGSIRVCSGFDNTFLKRLLGSHPSRLACCEIPSILCNPQLHYSCWSHVQSHMDPVLGSLTCSFMIYGLIMLSTCLLLPETSYVCHGTWAHRSAKLHKFLSSVSSIVTRQLFSKHVPAATNALRNRRIVGLVCQWICISRYRKRRLIRGRKGNIALGGITGPPYFWGM